MSKVIMVDWAGTFIRPEVIEEANLIRTDILKKAAPTSKEHGDPGKLYKANRDAVEKLTGLTEDMRLQYVQNMGVLVQLSGKDVQNMISTTFFQVGMLGAAGRFRQEITVMGFVDELKRCKELGYQLGVVSGVRTDIITGMLAIAGFEDLFDFVYGQPPMLGISNEENMAKLQEHGQIMYCIGDKYSDLEAGKGVGAQTIWVKWGHPSGDESEIADFIIDRPSQLQTIIN